MTPGETFKKAREILGLTQAELASELGVHQGTLTRWEQMESEQELHTNMHMHFLLMLVHKLVANSYIYNTGLVKEILDNIIYIRNHMPHARTKRPVHNDMHKEAKSLVGYFYYKHEDTRGYKLTPTWSRDIPIMSEILSSGGGEGFTKRLTRECIDTFLGYSKRTKTTIPDFRKSLDTVYGYIKDKTEGKRN